MQIISNTTTSPSATDLPRSMLWTGRVLLGLFLVFMALDIAMHFIDPPQVNAAFLHLGFPDSLSRVIAAISLVNVALYLIPRTALLGAVLQTGYFGGAVAMHIRVGDMTFLFAIMVATVMWLSLYCRDARLRTLFGSAIAPS